MRRAIPAIAATAGGLVLLANFHASPEPSVVAQGPAETSTTTTEVPATSLLPSTSRPGTSTTTTEIPTTTSAPNVVVGPIERNRWGDVQVQVTFNDTRIADIQPLRMPGDNSHSTALSRESAPILRREALQAQSAEIDVVSGATLTSESYIASLQGALDRRASR